MTLRHVTIIVREGLRDTVLGPHPVLVVLLERVERGVSEELHGLLSLRQHPLPRLREKLSHFHVFSESLLEGVEYLMGAWPPTPSARLEGP